ncbi:ParM/StbA family protein [Coleofasciculus sp. H7-2]|uniref:ParM/StbA family protein n=1 Tax=Coleofasciculus sp. H7-2 TaxID=3351545 RepID=UPI0036702A44
MQTYHQLPPPLASSPPAPVGYDGGNGSVKLVVDNAEVRIPSYVQPLHSEIYDIPESSEGSLIEYLAGDRTDLIGQRWLAGQPAYQLNPQAYLRTVDDRSGKIKYGLQLLLGSLGTMSHRPRWNLSIIASIQDGQLLGTELSKSLQGQHSIRINNKGVSWVDISVSAVLEEGAGAVISALASSLIQPKTQNIFLDLGCGTTISTIFGSGGKLVARKVTPGGVDSLIESIAKNLDVRRQLLKEGDRHLIRAAIENGSFEYGTTGWNFRQIYNTELKPWVSQNLATAFKAVDPWREQSDSIVAIGGGSQLPAIAQLLASQKIIVAPHGCWVNARGLARLAQIKLRRAV